MPKKKNTIPKPPPVEFEVTEHWIRTAIANSSNHCMIADSLTDQIPYAIRAEVDLQLIEFSDTERRVRYTFLTPENCQDALVAFDREEPIEPFTVRLDGRRLVRARRMQGRAGTKLATVEGENHAGHPVASVMDGQVVSHTRKKPPAAILSNRKGRVRRYGLRITEGRIGK